MSTFNPGTAEPTPERGSTKRDKDRRPSENPQVGEVPTGDHTENDGPQRPEGPQTTYDSGHGGTNTAETDADEVPENVSDIKDWINEADNEAERERRVNLAEEVENARTGTNRKGVTEAINEARRPR